MTYDKMGGSGKSVKEMDEGEREEGGQVGGGTDRTEYSYIIRQLVNNIFYSTFFNPNTNWNKTVSFTIIG